MKMFLIFIFVFAVMFSFFKPAYSVYINGNHIANVSNREIFENILKKANDEIAEILGDNMVIDEEPVYLLKIIPANAYAKESEITDKLMSIPGNIVKCCEITADGVFVAYAKNKSEAERILNSVSDAYAGYEKKLRTKVEYKDKYTAEFNLYTDDAVYNALKNNIVVESKEENEREIETPFEIIEQGSDKMTSGQTNVLRKGIPGKEMITTVYTLVNGIRESGKNVSKRTVLESTPEILEVGTKQITGIGSGVFMTPVSRGQISSRFGARGGRQTAHKGIDIACSVGTEVAAADEGICITAEYRNDYGNLIIVDHQNGYKTYYAHLNAINTSVGEMIVKGQIIGETGNTGISTGPHLHFEVRKDEIPFDPLEFVQLTE